jgi:hypothetical protein
MFSSRPASPPRGPVGPLLGGALLAIGSCTLSARALEIDTGDSDLQVRWDNTLRYNLGVRTQRQDPNILNNPNYDDSDSKFKRGDVVTDRLDVLSEFDLVHRKTSGLRVSGALWYDNAYSSDTVKTNPAFTLPGLGDTSSAYPDNKYTGYTRRWNRGPSGELLDAFVFAQFDAAGVPVDVKLGQHTIYWGESLFSFVHGVSYAQGPVDIRKALATPGVEAKEVFKPLPQISATVQLTDTLSVAGQYFFDWKPSPFPDGGTYFGVLDALTLGGGTYLINPALAAATSAQLGGTPVDPVPFIPIYKEPKKIGDWGLMARWSPSWLGGTAGLYVRQYTDKLPELVLGGFQGPPAALGVYIPTSFGLSYLDKRVTLLGASVSKQVAGMSVSAEVAHRTNTGLLMGPATVLGSEPVGDTWHALADAIAYFGKTPVFDSAALTGEVTFSRLDKVKSNAGNFNSVDYYCKDASDQLGCATKNAEGLTAKFEPQWFQVFPGADLSMPTTFSRGLKGTSPVLFGGYEGAYSYSIGLALDVKGKYTLNLAYNDSYARHTNADNALGLSAVNTIGGIGAQWDRGWVSFTAKMSF